MVAKVDLVSINNGLPLLVVDYFRLITSDSGRSSCCNIASLTIRNDDALPPMFMLVDKRTLPGHFLKSREGRVRRKFSDKGFRVPRQFRRTTKIHQIIKNSAAPIYLRCAEIKKLSSAVPFGSDPWCLRPTILIRPRTGQKCNHNPAGNIYRKIIVTNSRHLAA